MDTSTQQMESQRSGMLSRAITLLELVASHSDGIGVREAARRTGIDRSAVSRILTQFEEMGYVEQQYDRGVYGAGPRLFAMVAALAERDSLAKAALPLLEDLVERFNETCYVSARVGDSLVYRGKVDCDHTIRYVIELGKPFPLVGGASGIAILSGMTEEEREPIIRGPLVAHTDASITDPDELRRLLDADRAQGYTYSPGRWVPNGAGIAAPFFDASGRCAGAITLSSPIDRLRGRSIEEIGRAVQEAAATLSERLGYLGPRESLVPAGANAMADDR
jgi:DNA-binding IclR family transcriptional regulator